MDTNEGQMHYNLCTQTHTWEDTARTQHYSLLVKIQSALVSDLVVYLG